MKTVLLALRLYRSIRKAGRVKENHLRTPFLLRSHQLHYYRTRLATIRNAEAETGFKVPKFLGYDASEVAFAVECFYCRIFVCHSKSYEN
jgi:hypothetical protein